MPLSIQVRLRGGRYDAGGERPSEGEWPPHPARLFCALVASAKEEADWEALRWLERQPPPQVWCDPAADVIRGRASAYVVLNSVTKGGGNQNWPGRTNGLRARSFAVPRSDSFAFVWPGVEPAEDTLARLQRLARNVPYLGRSTSLAQAYVIGAAPSDMHGHVIYDLADRHAIGTWDLRVPYLGYCDELRAAYQIGRRSWEIARSRPYLEMRSDEMAADRVDAAPVAGPFSDLMVWGFERPMARIGGDQVIAIATSLRKAIMDLVSEPMPGQVSGHTEPGVPHVAFLVLPDVDHAHADGHVLGVGLALPDGLPSDDFKSLLHAALIKPSLTYVGFGGRRVAVRYGADGVGLRASRWTASARDGEREWVTVTPLALDGHTRRNRDEASEVARSLVIAGYPKPTLVETSMTPMLTGAVWRPRRDTWPDGRPRRQMVHARVRFPDPVIGPVLAGSMRYLGLGLFKPVSQRRAGPSVDSGAGPAAASGTEVVGEVAQASDVAEVAR